MVIPECEFSDPAGDCARSIGAARHQVERYEPVCTFLRDIAADGVLDDLEALGTEGGSDIHHLEEEGTVAELQER